MVLLAGCAHSNGRPAATATAAMGMHPELWSAPSPSQAAVCSPADLEGPKLATMPAPTIVTRSLTPISGPNLEELSPPDATTTVTADQAWSTLTNTGLNLPAATGTVQLLLGDLFAQTPAKTSPPRTELLPLYTSTPSCGRSTVNTSRSIQSVDQRRCRAHRQPPALRRHASSIPWFPISMPLPDGPSSPRRARGA